MSQKYRLLKTQQYYMSPNKASELPSESPQRP